MTLPKQLRFLLLLAGTLIVGALGNGLWELAKPGLVWVGNAVLHVATLGLTSLRDGLYVEIAKGTYERAAEKTLTLMIGVYTGLPIAIILVPLVRRSATETRKDPLELKKRRRFAIAILASMTLVLIVQNYRLIYIVRAANHLEIVSNQKEWDAGPMEKGHVMQ